MEPILQVNSKEEQPLEELISLALQVTDEELYLNRDNFLRVLRARDLKVQPAFEMWQRWYEWRKAYRADCISEEEMMPHIITGKAFFYGEDKRGRPCLIIRSRYHWPDQFSIENTMRFVIYCVEQAVQIADKNGVGQICVLYDRGNMTDDNRDHRLMELIRNLSAMLQDFYAERLGAVYVLHVNWIYWIMYQMVKPLVQRKTGDKIHVFRNAKGLTEFFDPPALMKEYGGTSDYVPMYPKRE